MTAQPAIKPVGKVRLSMSDHSRAQFDAEIATQVASSTTLAAINARIDHHIAKGAEHEAAIDAALADMEAQWAEDREFVPRWNAMSYQEALAFQRAREAV